MPTNCFIAKKLASLVWKLGEKFLFNDLLLYLLQFVEDSEGFAEKCHDMQTNSETWQNVIVVLKSIQTF